MIIGGEQLAPDVGVGFAVQVVGKAGIGAFLGGGECRLCNDLFVFFAVFLAKGVPALLPRALSLLLHG